VSSESNQTHWIPLSDLMTGMMLVFMLIAIVYMIRVQQVATDLRDVKGQIYTALDKEFGKDLKKWDAEILPNLTFRFKNPDALFPKGKQELTSNFKNVLDDFFPRYLKIIEDPKFEPTIKEVLIEGHTDQDFDKLDDEDVKKMNVDGEIKRYMNNMSLSQGRTWFTLAYLFEITPNISDKTTLIKKVHLHDVSSANPIYKEDGVTVDPEKSRRVEFKVITNSDERLEEIATALTTK